jgi:transposase
MQTRSKGCQLSEFERGLIVGAYKALHSERKVAELLQFPNSTVHKILDDFNHGRTQPAARKGRPQKTSERGNRIIRRVVRKNRKSTLSVLTEEVNKVLPHALSTRTVQRRMHQWGIYAHAARKVPLISRRNRIARVAWVRERLNWTMEQWKQILWSDESRFTLFQADGRVNVWREMNERYNQDCMHQTDRRGGPGVMVWGCFSWAGLGPLIICHGSMSADTYSDILHLHVYPTLLVMFGDPENSYFQDDNAPIHRAKRVIELRDSMGIPSLPWPAQSPDLNPIENLWSVLERRLRRRHQLPHTQVELEKALQAEWAAMAQEPEIFRKYVESMSERLHLVRKKLGYATKY